jgi:anti-anti-sigma regulatory factor
VVLDLSAATFVDAGGVRILLAVDTRARAASGTFAIASPTSPVERVLRLVGADGVLAILRPGILLPEPATPIRSLAAPAVARMAWL